MKSDRINEQEADILNFTPPDEVREVGSARVQIRQMPGGDFVATAFSMRANSQILARAATADDAETEICARL